MYNWSRVDEMLRLATHAPGSPEDYRLSKDLVAPGMVLLVSKAGAPIYHKAFGSRSLEPEITALDKDMTFDVASLTKALITTTLVMKQVQSGQLSLDKKLTHIFQTFGTLGKEKISIKHLLSHSSGYAAHRAFFQELDKANKGSRAGILGSKGAVDYVYNELFRSELDYPTGSKSVYSDLGFMLLAKVLGVVSGSSLEKLARREIFAPLELASSGFVDLSALKHHGVEAVQEVIVPTLAACDWRDKLLCGEVHDDNAWAMGGVCGHAGLFSNASDINKMASELVLASKGKSAFLSQEVVSEFWRKPDDVPGSSWALGWDTPDDEGSSAGKYFSKHSVGHLAYTGCSLWIDIPKEVTVVLLTNRIHPDDKNKAIKEFRPVIHDLVMDTLGYS